MKKSIRIQLLFLLLALLWIGGCWWGADRHFQGDLADLVEVEKKNAAVASQDVADSVRRNIHYRQLIYLENYPSRGHIYCCQPIYATCR